MKSFSKHRISPVWMHRLVRLTLGAFLIAIGLLYKDAWATYLFGALGVVLLSTIAGTWVYGYFHERIASLNIIPGMIKNPFAMSNRSGM